MMIKAHYQEIRQLRIQLIRTCLEMLTEAQKLEKERDTLKKTFCDDGMEEVDRLVHEILDKLAQSQSDMTKLAQILQVYADGLEASK